MTALHDMKHGRDGVTRERASCACPPRAHGIGRPRRRTRSDPPSHTQNTALAQHHARCCDTHLVPPRESGVSREANKERHGNASQSTESPEPYPLRTHAQTLTHTHPRTLTHNTQPKHKHM
eukprot:6195673-Pleurochrysis_carterae.AAC.3